MEVIPLIDLKSGRCVRLYQGDYQQETVYSEDPMSVASTWQQQGASRLHLVDLDGAAQGNPANLEIISAIVRQLTIPVQVGGGIRELATAEKLLSLGVDRVVIGTAAVENPRLVQELCQRQGDQRVVVALDARNGQIAIDLQARATQFHPEKSGSAGLKIYRNFVSLASNHKSKPAVNSI